MEPTSALIGAIYDAAIDERLWSTFLSRLARTFGCGQALLLSVDKEGEPSEHLLTEGLDLGIMAKWQGSKDHIDLWYQSLARAAPRQAYAYSQLVPRHRLRRSAFYSDFLRVSNVEFGLGTVVENDSGRQAIIALFSSKRRGDFVDEDRQLCTLLAPHLTKALAVNRHLRSAKNIRLWGIEALERLPNVAIVVDAHRRILFANRRAEALLSDEDGVSSDNGRLRVQTHAGQQQLQRMTSVRHSSHVNDPRQRDGTMSIPRRLGGAPHRMLVCPLPTLLRTSPAWLILIHDPCSGTISSGTALAAYYGLTRQETRFCQLFFETASLERTAELLEITRNTAKTYLKRVFQKVRVNSQAQLIRAIALGLSD